MKNKKLFIAGLSVVAIMALPACQHSNNSSTSESNSSSSNSQVADIKVASIEIVEDSIKSSYSVGDKVSYANLAIRTLDASKKTIATLMAADHATEITYTNIDTSEVATGKKFTVTYKNADGAFTAEMTYSVAEIEYLLTNWMPNKTYTDTVSTVANPKLSTSEDSPESGFIEKSKYYIGNDNAVNLLPIMTAVNPNDLLDTKTIDTIPSNVTVELSDSNGNKLALEDYFENVSELKSKGVVDFKETVEGSFALTFSSPDQDQQIKYEMNVVDGYNVTSAKDCFAIDSATWKFYGGDAQKMKTWKEEQGIPCANGLVFQKDVTFNKSDLPSFYFWGDEATAASVKGSYKDWQGLFDYTFAKEGTVTIYGNDHRLMLNDSATDEDAFPLIVTDSQTGQVQEANKPISTHASIFYTHESNGVDPSKCVFSIQDLEFSGNNGISAESTITTGGPMFIKSKTSCSVKNVNISKTYMAVMLDNWTSDGFHYSNIDVENCRFRNLANSAVYIYKNGTMNIKNSDLMTSGGPLIFLNPLAEKLPTFTGDVNAYAEAISKLVYTNVNVDEKSFLSNYTEGKGGWFAAYSGAESYAATIKSISPLTQAQFGMDFLKTDSSNVSKFDFTSFVLPISSGEGLGLDSNSGGINASFKVGDQLVYSTLDGASTVAEKALAYQTAYASGDTSAIQTAGLAYVDTLSTSDFGNGLTFAGQAAATTFKKFDSNGAAHYGLVNTDGTNYWVENTKYTILKSMGYDDTTLAALGVEKYPGEAFKSEGYLSAEINSIVMPGSPTKFTSFEGVCNYGLILGNYHKVS